MKKLLKFSFLSILAVLTLTACDSSDHNDGGQTGGNVNFYSGAYYGDAYKNGTAIYSLLLNDNGVTLTKSDDGIVPSGEGNVYSLQLISTPSTSMIPENGTYAVNDTHTALSVEKGYMYDIGAAMFGDAYAGIYVIPAGSYVSKINADTIAEQILITGGSLKVETGKMTGTFNLEDGTTLKISCKGTFTFTDNSEEEGGDEEDDKDFSFEPTEISTINNTFTSVKANYYGDYYNKGSQVILMTLQEIDADSNAVGFTQLEFYVADTANINGTYQITATADTKTAGTAMVSPGGDAQYDYPCFYGTTYNEKGYYTQAYYFESGQITISSAGLSYNAISYNGSTLNGTYSGKIQLIDQTQASSVRAKMASMKNMQKAPIIRMRPIIK